MKRLGAAVAIALNFPAFVSAQQSTATPNKALAITQSLGAFAGQYDRWLTAAFDSIPAPMYGYKPTATQQSVGYIAQHLENANYQR